MTKAACFAGLLLVVASPVHGQGRVDIDVFYDRLEPYGAWLESPHFGLVWQPSQVSRDYRPYSDGHWVWTDDYGWYWDSNAPWSWATDHYGRWYLDDAYGWLWVPGAEWAPAWVAWRQGGGYLGWAPLPPTALWRPGIGLDYDQHSADLPPDAWVFVDEHQFASEGPSRVMFAPSRNASVIVRTRNITTYHVRGHRVFNEGLPRHRAEVVLRRPVPRLRVEHSHRVADVGRAPHRHDGRVRIYAPEVRTVHDRHSGSRRHAPSARRPVMRERVHVREAPPVRHERERHHRVEAPAARREPARVHREAPRRESAPAHRERESQRRESARRESPRRESPRRESPSDVREERRREGPPGSRGEREHPRHGDHR